MPKFIIVDAGGTKTDWVMVKDGIVEGGRVSCPGLNAILSTDKKIREVIEQAKSELPEEKPDAIFYYGAGCATEAACNRISIQLSEIWPGVPADVNSDMLGAARGLLGNKRGIACILGTGSNSCLYDGNEIADGIPSLGFILGDEGSGAALGRRLMTDVLKRQLPEYLRDQFKEEYSIELSEVLENVYKHPEPNRYLASFVPFLASRLLDPYIYQLVLREFTRFVKRNVLPYPGAVSLPIAFTGSISHHFEKILREAASQVGIPIKTITQSPLEGLIAYHSESFK